MTCREKEGINTGGNIETSTTTSSLYTIKTTGVHVRKIKMYYLNLHER
jgi:hypothetical protein